MKKSLIALSILALAAGSALAHGSSGTATGSNSLTSNSATSASASGTGAATSEAWNQGRASTSVNGNGTAGSLTPTATYSGGPFGTVTTTDGKYGNVSTGGTTFTLNASGVRTTQSGSALATGAASGVASSQAAGQGEFHTVGTGPKGSVAGNSNSFTSTGVASLGNGEAVRNAGMSGSFGASASADITNTTVKNTFLYVPTNTVSQADVKNVNTAAGATAVSNGGFSGISNTTSGFAGGFTTNTSTGSAAANASVAGKVSASH